MKSAALDLPPEQQITKTEKQNQQKQVVGKKKENEERSGGKTCTPDAGIFLARKQKLNKN